MSFGAAPVHPRGEHGHGPLVEGTPARRHLSGATVFNEPYPPRAWLFRSAPMATLPNYPRDRRTVAFHEAGHACIAHLLRLPFRDARVQADGSGFVDFDKDRIQANAAAHAGVDLQPALMERAATELASMYLSGTMAELLLHGLAAPGWLKLDTPDWRCARTLLREVFDFDLGGPVYYCQQLARAVLTENWNWVAAVAGKIEANGSVSADDIARLSKKVLTGDIRSGSGRRAEPLG